MFFNMFYLFQHGYKNAFQFAENNVLYKYFNIVHNIAEIFSFYYTRFFSHFFLAQYSYINHILYFKMINTINGRNSYTLPYKEN